MTEGFCEAEEGKIWPAGESGKILRETAGNFRPSRGKRADVEQKRHIPFPFHLAQQTSSETIP